MSKFFRAELKDRFLEYTMEYNELFEARILYDEFLRPNYDLEFMEGLLQEILEFDPELLYIEPGHGRDFFKLAPTVKTEDFLESGGFMDLYVKEEEKWDLFLGQLSTAKIPSNKVKKEFRPNALKKEKSMLLVLISAIALSFLFTMVSIVNQTFLEPEYVPADEFERKLELLQQQYIQENERLQFKLQRAQYILDSLSG